MCTDEYGSKTSDNRFTARQPRTLSLAIVPGEHVCSISLAKNVELPGICVSSGPSEEGKSLTSETDSTRVLEEEHHDKETNQTCSNCTATTS